jgi:ABC-2 type transport system permease protein
VGARFSGGAVGWLVMLAAAILLGTGFGALSNGLALLVRSADAVIAAVQALVLPLTFLSSAYMKTSLEPGWIQAISKYNPMEWAVTAGREALSSGTDWRYVWEHLGYLAAFAVVGSLLAMRAFRAYQRSI